MVDGETTFDDIYFFGIPGQLKKKFILESNGVE
jgi:signal recognition particle receptor subunit beta